MDADSGVGGIIMTQITIFDFLERDLLEKIKEYRLQNQFRHRYHNQIEKLSQLRERELIGVHGGLREHQTSCFICNKQFNDDDLIPEIIARIEGIDRRVHTCINCYTEGVKLTSTRQGKKQLEKIGVYFD